MEGEREPLIKRRRTGWGAWRRSERAYRPSASDVFALSSVVIGGILIWLFAASHVRDIHRYPHHPPQRKYDGEHITWTFCDNFFDHEVECANLTVPMDQFNATNNGPDNKNFSIPLIRMRGKNATDNINILLNPGGPGGSGVEFLYRRGKQLNAIVGENFHLLSFDPRGVNQSVPRADCYPSDEARREMSLVRDKRAIQDSGELWAWTSGHVKGCVDTMGVHGSYINTPQTAADMNSILDAVGQEDMYYWGFSYGTLLGQTYATLFRERSKRVIIDGVVNQFDWYGSILDREELADTDNVFAGFVEECLKAGPEDCALAGLAKTKEELSKKLIASISKLKDEPVGVYVNATIHGVLDYWAVWFGGVFPALYKPANWRDLATNLAGLLQGNATKAFLAYGQDGPWDLPGEPNEMVSLNDGASGPEKWGSINNRAALVDTLLELFNESSFHENSLSHYFAKQAWVMPRGHTYVPKKGVQTAHPLLVLSTTYDPVCPLVSARSANDAFVGSKIVELKGYGHCTLALPSLCIARHVRGYLSEGKLPESNVQCDVDGKPYFAKPDEDGKALVGVKSLDEEEMKIHLAQLELARDSWFTHR
ncbi:Alpha/Beta hydrolase protein [Podospora fimiseda]|uniref:Alpha/Beta hydrolase protein n=1 Tax=Podospora fimiseda TaxID=252190 RepID=A0AAN6YQY2_9PEZI|nr:Alpha/Beta hydrolase protein [Podospora fimiseda]